MAAFPNARLWLPLLCLLSSLFTAVLSGCECDCCGSSTKAARLRQPNGAGVASKSSVGVESGKVKLGLYVEAMCPYCQATMVKGWMNDLMSGDYDEIFTIMDLFIVPWGNAKEESDGSFTCQHGPNECKANAYELCALTLLGGNDTAAIASGAGSREAWPFLHCLEEAQANLTSVGQCTKGVAGLKEADLHDCVSNRYSEVMQQGALVTDELCQEPCGCHTFVPWATVDGDTAPWGDDGQPQDVVDVIDAVCQAYVRRGTITDTGTAAEPLPDLCLHTIDPGHHHNINLLH